MTWNLVTLSDVLDKVTSILQTIWWPIILGVFAFSLLGLFLHFKN